MIGPRHRVVRDESGRIAPSWRHGKIGEAVEIKRSGGFSENCTEALRVVARGQAIDKSLEHAMHMIAAVYPDTCVRPVAATRYASCAAESARPIGQVASDNLCGAPRVAVLRPSPSRSAVRAGTAWVFTAFSVSLLLAPAHTAVPGALSRDRSCSCSVPYITHWPVEAIDQIHSGFVGADYK